MHRWELHRQLKQISAVILSLAVQLTDKGLRCCCINSFYLLLIQLLLLLHLLLQVLLLLLRLCWGVCTGLAPSTWPACAAATAGGGQQQSASFGGPTPAEGPPTPGGPQELSTPQPQPF